MTIVETGQITGGVDTHLDAHVTAALDGNGGTLGVESFPTTTNQLRHLGFCGPDDLRERFRGVTVDTLPQTAAAMRPDSAGDPVMYATKLAMQTLGRRVLDIDADCARLHGELTDLVKATAQSLLDRIGDRDDVTAIRIGRPPRDELTRSAGRPVPATSRDSLRHRALSLHRYSHDVISAQQLG